MAARKSLTVDYAGGVCIREKGSKDSKILAVLPYGAKVAVDTKTEAPAGWIAVAGGGFTMTEFLK